MIRPKQARCTDCSQFGPVTGGRCPKCYRNHKAKEAAQSAEQKAYRKVRNEYLSAYPMCQARLDGCQGEATEVHHKRGRVGRLLTDARYFLAVCHSCHEWIELHPQEAKKLGFSMRRLAENQ